MFNVSLLAIVVSTSIAITSVIVGTAALVGGVVFTSVKLHSKRKSEDTKKETTKKQQSKGKTKAPVKEEVKQQTKTKTTQKTNTTVKTKTPKKTVQQPVFDKSNLIGEQEVVADDLTKDSKYKWAYSIKITSQSNPESNMVLSWKTNDYASLKSAIEHDKHLVRCAILNKKFTNMEIGAKISNLNQEPEIIQENLVLGGDLVKMNVAKEAVKNFYVKINGVKTAQSESVEEEVL